MTTAPGTGNIPFMQSWQRGRCSSSKFHSYRTSCRGTWKMSQIFSNISNGLRPAVEITFGATAPKQMTHSTKNSFVEDPFGNNDADCRTKWFPPLPALLVSCSGWWYSLLVADDRSEVGIWMYWNCDGVKLVSWECAISWGCGCCAIMTRLKKLVMTTSKKQESRAGESMNFKAWCYYSYFSEALTGSTLYSDSEICEIKLFYATPKFKQQNSFFHLTVGHMIKIKGTGAEWVYWK